MIVLIQHLTWMTTGIRSTSWFIMQEQKLRCLGYGSISRHHPKTVPMLFTFSVVKKCSKCMLERHIKRKHPKNFVDALTLGAQKSYCKFKLSNCQAQCSLESYVVSCPAFADCLMNWAIATYQPLGCCEEESFHELCLSLKKNSPMYGREKFHTML